MNFCKILDTLSKQSFENYVNTGFSSAESPRTLGALIFHKG
jgi:hypothetical protein